MTTTTTTPTVAELQRRITSLREEKQELEDLVGELQDRLDTTERDDQESSEQFTDRARQVLLDHHDEAGHRGSQRFCTASPCPALNAPLDEWGVR